VRIDLNVDVGEGAEDLPIFPLVTSVSIACGAHAGDVETMRRCVAEAERLGVVVGAHPGYPDRAGSGRQPMTMSDDALAVSLADQILALDAVAQQRGLSVVHVKPHGALYNQAAVDPGLAAIIVEVVRTLDPTMRLIALANSAMIAAARDAGLSVASESFADRRYRADGTLAPRSLAGAVIEDPATAAAQALALALGNPIETVDGTTLTIETDTICLHADSPGAVAIARAVREALNGAGVEVAPLSRG
jgi:5-oxoprolinase (ATP-hydrolysing) subunit A